MPSHLNFTKLCLKSVSPLWESYRALCSMASSPLEKISVSLLRIFGRDSSLLPLEWQRCFMSRALGCSSPSFSRLTSPTCWGKWSGVRVIRARSSRPAVPGKSFCPTNGGLVKKRSLEFLAALVWNRASATWSWGGQMLAPVLPVRYHSPGVGVGGPGASGLAALLLSHWPGHCG